MAFRTIVKFGLPIGFTYCTIYQQDIWREGDERLIKEQKRLLMKIVTPIDRYTFRRFDPNAKIEDRNIEADLEALNPTLLWNTAMMNVFSEINTVVSNPEMIACTVYRHITQDSIKAFEFSKTLSKKLLSGEIFS